jgi:hypothetical protein
MFRAPGFVVSQEQTLAATLVLNTMFIFSVFVFATLIGLVGDEVKQSVSSCWELVQYGSLTGAASQLVAAAPLVSPTAEVADK